MRAISLWQPFATLMAIGVKTIETRSWQTGYRGPLVICATKAWNYDVLRALRDAVRFGGSDDWAQMVDALRNAGYAMLGDLPLGKAVCQVEVYDCKPSSWFVESRLKEAAFGDFSPGRFGILTRNCQQFATPFPVVGRQGFFDVPDALVKEALKS